MTYSVLELAASCSNSATSRPQRGPHFFDGSPEADVPQSVGEVMDELRLADGCRAGQENLRGQTASELWRTGSDSLAASNMDGNDEASVRARTTTSDRSGKETSSLGISSADDSPAGTTWPLD